MTETTTLTEEVTDQSSSDIGDESLLDNDSEQNSAVEDNDDTDSSESEDSDSEHSSSTNEDSSDEDKGLAKFAKSQGFDPNNLTSGERKALKLAHDNQKAYRKSADQAKQSKLNDEVETLYKPGENDDERESMRKEIALSRAERKTNAFWTNNPDDRRYEADMIKALQAEKADYGDAAAKALSQNLPRLLREAKFIAEGNSSDAARETGRREERLRLRKSQEGSADSAHASTTAAKSATKIDRDWVENTYDSSKPEDRKTLDEAMARGDLY